MEKAKAARQKSKEFAKNIPKPKLANKDKPKQQRSEVMEDSPQKEAFLKLQARHEMYADEMAKFKKEYASMMEMD